MSSKEHEQELYEGAFIAYRESCEILKDYRARLIAVRNMVHLSIAQVYGEQYVKDNKAEIDARLDKIEKEMFDENSSQ